MAEAHPVLCKTGLFGKNNREQNRLKKVFVLKKNIETFGDIERHRLTIYYTGKPVEVDPDKTVEGVPLKTVEHRHLKTVESDHRKPE
jgi:hypothetical protein